MECFEPAHRRRSFQLGVHRRAPATASNDGSSLGRANKQTLVLESRDFTDPMSFGVGLDSVMVPLIHICLVEHVTEF